MNENLPEIAQWLASGGLSQQAPSLDEWAPGFDVDRQIVCSKIAGLYQKIFLRPDIFHKRFYHSVFALPIDEWHFNDQLDLFDGFCQISVSLDLRFQATLTYVQRNPEQLPDINAHIKSTFQQYIYDCIYKQIHLLNDGKWVQQGLFEVEKNIALGICEMLMVQNVQSQATCKLAPYFKEFSNIKPGKDCVYLSVLKQSHVLTGQKNQSLFEQQAILKQQKIEQKKEQLIYLQHLADIERQKRAQQAAERLELLQDEEQVLNKELAIEKRIHVKRVKHQQELRELEAEAQLETQKKIQGREYEQGILQREQKRAYEVEVEKQRIMADRQRREDQLIHQAKIQDEKTQAEIQRYEKQQKAWQEARLRNHQQQMELKKRQKLLEDNLEEELLKLEREAREENGLVLPFQKLKSFEEMTDRSKIKKSESLRHEIELSMLERQRLELEQAIHDAQNRTPDQQRDVDR